MWVKSQQYQEHHPTLLSLRTVIPMSIINQWKLKEGDKLDWEWQVLKGEMVLVVKKARK
jgi:hypothetical protein